MQNDDETVDAHIVDDADCKHDVVIAGICLKCEKKVSSFSILSHGVTPIVQSDPRGKGKTYFY